MVGAIAQEYLTDRAKHDKTAGEWTRRYAQCADFAAPCSTATFAATHARICAVFVCPSHVRLPLACAGAERRARAGQDVSVPSRGGQCRDAAPAGRWPSACAGGEWRCNVGRVAGGRDCTFFEAPESGGALGGTEHSSCYTNAAQQHRGDGGRIQKMIVAVLQHM